MVTIAQRIAAQRTLEVELVADVGKNVSRAEAKTLYRVLLDEKVAG